MGKIVGGAADRNRRNGEGLRLGTYPGTASLPPYSEDTPRKWVDNGSARA